MLFTGREVRIGKNCARGLEYGPRPQAEGRTQDQRHSFSLYGPPGREITYIYFLGEVIQKQPANSYVDYKNPFLFKIVLQKYIQHKKRIATLVG